VLAAQCAGHRAEFTQFGLAGHTIENTGVNSIRRIDMPTEMTQQDDVPLIRISGIRTREEAHGFLQAGADLVSPRIDFSEDNYYDFHGGIPPQQALREFRDFGAKERLGLEFMQMDEQLLSYDWSQVSQSGLTLLPLPYRFGDPTLRPADVLSEFDDIIFYNVRLDELDWAWNIPYQIAPTVSEWGVQTYEIEVLSDYQDSWGWLHSGSDPKHYPSHRDVQLGLRDFDFFLNMDWTPEKTLREAPKFLTGLEGITIVVDHDDTENWRVTGAVDLEPALELTGRVKQAFRNIRKSGHEENDQRPADDIRKRSEFSHILIVSEFPEAIRDAVNTWYDNYKMSGYERYGDTKEDPGDGFIHGIDAKEYSRTGRECWACEVWHDSKYIDRITEIVEQVGGRVYEWPEVGHRVRDALEALEIP
jgi:hypothetical protein